MGLKVFHEGVWKSYPAKTYAEYTHEWLGEPHASESVRLDTHGNETARNEFLDPKPWSTTPFSVVRSSAEILADGGIRLTTITPDVGSQVRIDTTSSYRPVVTTGQYVAVAFDTRSLDGIPTRCQLQYSTASNDYLATDWVHSHIETTEAWSRHVGSVHVVTEDAGLLSLRLSNANLPRLGDTFDFRNIHIAIADNEAEALAQVEHYFDGGTPPSRAWANFTPRNISGIKRIWPRSESPPPPGVHYEWLGEPHGSVSVRLDGDGNETARNIVTEPTKEVSDTTLFRFEIDSDDLHNAVGKRAVAIFSYKSDSEASSSPDAYIRDDSNALILHKFSYFTRPQEWTEYALPFVIPESVLNASNLSLTVRDFAAANEKIAKDVALVILPDESVEVEHYFDGGTVSDRANDLWYNADGVPHVWVNGQGWVAISDVTN